MNQRNDRREFLKASLLTAMTSALPAGAFWIPRPARAARARQGFPGAISPIASLDPASAFASTDFNGDEIDLPHDLLWHKDTEIAARGGIPSPSEFHPVVIVGGGISGLVSAYQLRDLRPLVLEGARSFGGNSKGERFGDAEYSIGAAYISRPDADSETAQLLNELGVLNRFRVEDAEDLSVSFGNQLKSPFWSGATDPSRAAEFERAYREFTRIKEEAYPEIPLTEKSSLSRAELDALDRLTFKDWLGRTFGKVHPHIEEFAQLYAWSSFGGSIDELSAAQMLNFFAADLGGTIAIPGGNAAVVRALLDRLNSSIGSDRLRARAFVVDIARKGDRVRVCYVDPQGSLKTIESMAVIVASPKMVARRLISDMPLAQANAIDWITYRAYIVANVLVEGRTPSPVYDLFCLRGQVPDSPVPLKPEPRPFSDVCMGTWAANDRTSNGILTIYKALPYDGARQLLFHPSSHDKHKRRIEAGLPEILRALGIAESRIKGVRLTRWGHALPLARQGLIASGRLEEARRPVADRIFFANQDCWANPCFETASASAREAAANVRALI